MGRRAGQFGFTLIELLVVVSIVGVLCAIMVPAVSRARVRAKKVACGAGLHGLAIGMKAYVSQYGERYPVAAQMPSVNVGLAALPKALASEVLTAGNGARAWKCGADNMGYVRASDGAVFDSYFEGETLSYEYNMSLGGKRLEQDFLYPLVGAPGVFVLADFDGFHGAKAAAASKNLLFGDGHVGGIEDIANGLQH